jgi:tetratricopeptide (TPR) repeat protein
MHEFVRQYAAEQLATHPHEDAATRARHAAFYAALVRQVTPSLRQTVTAQQAISAEVANIRVAWDWAAERAEADLLDQMLVGLAKWYEFQGIPGQASEALGQAAARLRAAIAQAVTPDPSLQPLLGFVCAEEALALSWQGAHDRAVPLFEEALDLARITASPHLEARVAYYHGWQLVRQRDLPSATPWMQRALALARAAHQADLEADTLLHLGMGAVHAGEYPRARGYLDAALALYRAQHHRLGETLVFFTRGLLAHACGDFGEAQRLLRHTLRLTDVLQWHLVHNWVLHELGLVADEGWGRHTEAEGFFVQELRITQETGDRAREGFALAALGRNALYQGDLERARALLDRAERVSREVASQESAAMALRGLSLLAHYQGDDRHARLYAEEALGIARTAGLRRDERLALRLLGQALLGLGALPDAAAAYRRVADLDDLLGFHYLRIETATDQARVAMAQGDTDRALAHVTALLPDLIQGAPAGIEEPALAFVTCYRVLLACGDSRADAALATGHAMLRERAAQFSDEGRRTRFLDALPAHRDLLAAWRAHFPHPFKPKAAMPPIR